MAKGKENFISPYEVNYEEFLKAIPKDVTVENYCKGHLTKEEIDFVVEDLQHYKHNLKQK